MVTVSKIAFFTLQLSLEEEVQIQVPALKCIASALQAEDPKITEHALHNHLLTRLVNLSTKTVLGQHTKMVNEILYAFLNIIGGD